MIIIGPYYVIIRYKGKNISNTKIGDIVLERDGVKDRRGYFSHHFTDEELEKLKKEMKQYGHLNKVSFVDTLPSNWRHPTGI